MSKNEQILKDFLKKGDNKKCFVCGQNVSPFLRGINCRVPTVGI